MKKYISRFQKTLFFSLIVIIGIVGIYLGRITVHKYDIYVDAVLGLTLLYFLYQPLLSSNKEIEKPTGLALEFPRDFKFWFIVFF